MLKYSLLYNICEKKKTKLLQDSKLFTPSVRTTQPILIGPRYGLTTENQNGMLRGYRQVFLDKRPEMNKAAFF